MNVNVAVIILTFNEELNLPYALASVRGWAREVFVLDSFSSDRTVELAVADGCTVVQHRFVDYGSQRNFALSELPITAEWVFFLDADERLSDGLKREITAKIAEVPRENGFFVRFRLLWMGKWIRHGYYGAWLLRLFRHGHARCEARAANEHVIVDGELGHLHHDILHEDHNGLTRWIEKHNAYATKEAEALLLEPPEGELDARLLGTQTQRKRWIKLRLWNRLPPIARPLVYFGYRYVLRGGFLDGPEGLSYHMLQGLWLWLLVDLKYLEMQRAGAESLGPGAPVARAAESEATTGS